MPASHERVPNKPLSGQELAKRILMDVEEKLRRDGMFSLNMAYGRASYEVRVSLHLDNPLYPEHIVVVVSRPASKQQIEKNPELGSLELAPLSEPSDEEVVVSEERQRIIQSANALRAESDMPIQIQKRNMDTGQLETKEQKFVGDMPDPLSVGNLIKDSNTVDDQRNRWKTPRKGR